MAFNALQQLHKNVLAARVALNWDEQRKLRREEIAALREFGGFGGIKAVLYGPGDENDWIRQNASQQDMRLHPAVLELYHILKETLNEDAYKAIVDSIKRSSLTAYYTPSFVPAALFDALTAQNILPQHFYEPSAGIGVFIDAAIKANPDVQITAVEKDLLTGRILKGVSQTTAAEVQIKGFEETAASEKGKYDLIASNIPFGNLGVFDPAYQNSPIASRIHNYFFAKGLDKLRDGGLLAYLVTEAFLNTPGNETARKHVFTSADFISVSVLPDNLMKDNANVEAPSHLLIVQKNDDKKEFSEEEALLIDITEQENDAGKFPLNAYLARHPELILGDEIAAGTNQYGKPSQTIWMNGDMEDLAKPLQEQIAEGLSIRFNREKWNAINKEIEAIPIANGKLFTFLPEPETKVRTIGSVAQLGLFDAAPTINNDRAQAYLSQSDEAAVEAASARVISTIRTTDHPEHESLVMLTARAKNSGRYVYKLYSNIAEIKLSNKWLSGNALTYELKALSARLKYFGHDYRYEGDGFPINGHPLSVKEANALAKSLLIAEKKQRNFLNPKGLLNPNVVFLKTGNDGFAIWRTPQQKIKLLFTESLDIPIGEANIPALLWKAGKNSLSIFAVQDENINTNSILYHAPFFNVYAEGRVCMGNVAVKIPNDCALENFMTLWQDYFFNSYFSHLFGNHQPIKGNIVQLWQKQVNSGGAFPMECLIANNIPLNKLIA